MNSEIKDLFSHQVRERPEADALSFRGETWTYGDLGERVGRSRGVLRAWGLKPGDLLMVMCRNHPAWVLLKLAAGLEGIGFIAISWRLTAHELRHHLDLAPVACLVSDQAGAITAAVCPVKTLEDFGDALASGEDLGLARSGGPPGKTLLFTGGTTGLPKAVVRRPGGELARAAMMAREMRLGAEDVHHLFAPLYHSGPGLFLSIALYTGAAAVLHDRFQERVLIREIAGTSGAVIFGVPTHYRRLMTALEEHPGKKAFAANIKTAVCAGAPLSAHEAVRLESVLGPDKLWEFYGSTETGTVTLMPPQRRAEAPGSVGLPPPGTEVLILDEAGKGLGPGKEGLIYVKNDSLMEGYFGDPEATAACMSEGFVTVKDVGYRNEKGFLFLCDRRSDLILCGGVNVYPAEIEAVLETIPGVAHAAVVGEADEELGEAPEAYLEWKGVPWDEARLNAYVAERLARYKRPRRWHEVMIMPLSPVGKVERRLVKEMAQRDS